MLEWQLQTNKHWGGIEKLKPYTPLVIMED